MSATELTSQYWMLITDWLLLSGFIGFLLMGLDKSRAKSHSRRISERTFFELALVGGVFGIAVGSGVFHHKSSKISFIGVILAMAILWVVILFFLQRLLGPPPSVLPQIT